ASHELGRILRAMPIATADAWTFLLRAADTATEIGSPLAPRFVALAHHFSREVAVRDGRAKVEQGRTMADARARLEEVLRLVSLTQLDCPSLALEPRLDERPTADELALLKVTFELRKPPAR
ncbi:MAG: hypothetical protein ACAI25_16110, partial [Planctomycetota bacterium]